MDTYYLYTITTKNGRCYLQTEVPTKKAVAVALGVNIRNVQRGVSIRYIPMLNKPMTPVTSKSQ